MRVDGDVGQKLLAALEKVEHGGYIEFHSPMPGLTEEHVVFMLREKKESVGERKSWTFDAYWFDVYIGKAKAELFGKDLNFTVIE
ncbi:hypothetical protein CPT_Summit_148 [Stenotrophomonas phage Summit]|nr:hypothetical protein CPT_Summit_148 [Stenotrophomonas phage Summit]